MCAVCDVRKVIVETACPQNALCGLAEDAVATEYIADVVYEYLFYSPCSSVCRNIIDAKAGAEQSGDGGIDAVSLPSYAEWLDEVAVAVSNSCTLRSQWTGERNMVPVMIGLQRLADLCDQQLRARYEEFVEDLRDALSGR